MLPLFTYPHETLHAVSPWVEYVPYEIWGQKVKGQGHNARITENGFKRITASPLHLSSWNFTCSLPMSQVWALWNSGSKGQGHNARITENGFKRITASPFHLSSWNFTCSLPMSRVCALWNLGSKGQRSRSQCKDYWKWFQANNCFPFTPILMKLHMQSPHDSSMGPMKFGVKRSKVKVTTQELLKMVSGA